MMDVPTVISTLAPLNGVYFSIDDLELYATKVLDQGRHLSVWGPDGPRSYVLYYENEREFFVSMVWTHPSDRGQGLATDLLRELARIAKRARKPIRLSTREDNPATSLYRGLGFLDRSRTDGQLTMQRPLRVAVMQPYAFPYLGYFHLIEASDTFVFYDDVNYIPRGWINRNNVVSDGVPHRFTIPVSKASQNSLIRDVRPAIDEQWLRKFSSTLEHSYRKASYRREATDLVMSVVSTPHDSIGALAISSIVRVYEYLNLPMPTTVTSSELGIPSGDGGPGQRLCDITHSLERDAYVNAAGGRVLYDKADFARLGVDLSFVESRFTPYSNGSDFLPGMSIIDMLMHCSPAQVADQFATFHFD
ncbi:hypothetical protein ASD62_16470 [Phycicoccus sp. Root563]|uniref:WbqC family protein n=1 Tax=Phycicoccus sp. Root563 TaxID=1736562 RepID=UPI0007039EFF|nr:WbqC family protein [Phycicoccus sp. Root563]KQZ90643.1 hypothetical protein ASD62_16470 [Phycicoccus sp. Root563]